MFLQVYNTLWQSLGLMARQEGMRGFYRGVVPAVIQIVPYNGASFAFYAKFQSIYRNITGKASSESGAWSKVDTYSHGLHPIHLTDMVIKMKSLKNILLEEN